MYILKKNHSLKIGNSWIQESIFVKKNLNMIKNNHLSDGITVKTDSSTNGLLSNKKRPQVELEPQNETSVSINSQRQH